MKESNETDRDNLPSQRDRSEHQLSDKQRYTNDDDEESQNRCSVCELLYSDEN